MATAKALNERFDGASEGAPKDPGARTLEEAAKNDPAAAAYLKQRLAYADSDLGKAEAEAAKIADENAEKQQRVFAMLGGISLLQDWRVKNDLEEIELTPIQGETLVDRFARYVEEAGVDEQALLNGTLGRENVVELAR